jgi:hypothetical protein
MKRLFVMLVAVALVFASDLIPLDDIEILANSFVQQKYGAYHLDEVVTYYGLDELPGAYGFIYRNNNDEPLTIVMGARYTTSPVNEISRSLPRSKDIYNTALNKARTLGYGEPEFQRYYYFGPGEEYCNFIVGDQDIMINSCTFRTLAKADMIENMPVPNPELEHLTRLKWQKYFNAANFLQGDTNYIPGVPYIDWVYGCSPTAASMIMWYWDPLGYGRLVDFFYMHWDQPEGEYNICANTNRELALAMYTDTLSGGTSIANICNGMIAVANATNGYSCTGQTSPQGGSWNNWQFSWAKGEIDNGRPFHWNVLYYYEGGQFINHSVTGVGYGVTATDTFIQVHNTWQESEPYWALWTYHSGTYSYDYVVTFIPNGSVSDNIFLDNPVGPGFVFKDIKYKIKWTDAGSQIDHVKMWYSIGRDGMAHDSVNWTLIDANAANTGEYLWVAPNQDSSLRINIAGLNSSNQRLAADGAWSPLGCVYPDHSTNLDLVGHLVAAHDAYDVVIVNDYAYVANGSDGLMVADISDSSLPEDITTLDLPGISRALYRQGSYLYIADQEDTLRIISISDPANPTQVSKLALTCDQPRSVFVTNNTAYIPCRATGVEIVDVSTPGSPSWSGSFNTSGQAYDVFVDDTLAYVADGTMGIRVWGVADPANCSEIGYYNTDGITQGIDKSGDYVYLAEGGAGIKVFNVNDPTDPQEVGSLDTDGTAASVLMSDSLYVCDGSGGLVVVDVSTPSSPVEVGYLDSYGSANNIAHNGELLYLADIGDGVYVIHEDFEPAVEEMAEQPLIANFMIASPQTKSLKFNIALEKRSDLSVKIYDAVGRIVKSMEMKGLESGEHDFQWSASAAGVYFVSVETDHGTTAKKVVFLK